MIQLPQVCYKKGREYHSTKTAECMWLNGSPQEIDIGSRYGLRQYICIFSLSQPYPMIQIFSSPKTELEDPDYFVN